MRYEVLIGQRLSDDGLYEDQKNIVVNANDELTAAFRAGSSLGRFRTVNSFDYEVIAIRSEADAQ